jgi:hypothetical protein
MTSYVWPFKVLCDGTVFASFHYRSEAEEFAASWRRADGRDYRVVDKDLNPLY